VVLDFFIPVRVQTQTTLLDMLKLYQLGTRQQTTAQTLFDNFIVHYGIPQRIHSDQGANFESKIIKELCTLTGMKKSRTTSYHPMGNGMCERFNRTIKLSNSVCAVVFAVWFLVGIG
jgi:transposase InsO family protein